ncbi:MAG: NAD-dependent epimerase/dehydratase family protein [Deltaproteobacteria bacterium]|nr:NAD-dependent epimerase/dehydratase family protein [Deltaproteobacteria bacterium]
MRILVTGGAGFIGSHVVDAYVGAGHEVLVLDDLSTGRPGQVHPRAEFCQADLRAAPLDDLFRRFRPEVVNQHAALAEVRRSVAAPALDAERNVMTLLRVLEACVRHGVARVVFASSGGAIYGEGCALPTPETATPAPVSPYGASKLIGEHYLRVFHRLHGLPYLALRYANVYGPRQDPAGEAGVVAIFTDRLLAGRSPVINGDGEQTRDYLFVGDAARANVLALAPEAVGPVNIGTGQETSVNELYRQLCAVVGQQTSAMHGPPKAGEQRRSALDASRAQAWLGWRPATSLAEGLRQSVEAFRRGRPWPGPE